jgi:hypothetical protein
MYEFIKEHIPYFQIKTIEADGNCQYRAIGHVLDKCPIKVRETAVRELMENKFKYSSFVEEDYELFVNRHFTNSVWGDNITLQAIANAFNIQVSVYNAIGKNKILINEELENPSQSIHLLFVGNCHYNVILERQEHDTDIYKEEEVGASRSRARNTRNSLSASYPYYNNSPPKYSENDVLDELCLSQKTECKAKSSPRVHDIYIDEDYINSIDYAEKETNFGTSSFSDLEIFESLLNDYSNQTEDMDSRNDFYNRVDKLDMTNEEMMQCIIKHSFENDKDMFLYMDLLKLINYKKSSKLQQLLLDEIVYYYESDEFLGRDIKALEICVQLYNNELVGEDAFLNWIKKFNASQTIRAVAKKRPLVHRNKFTTLSWADQMDQMDMVNDLIGTSSQFEPKLNDHERFLEKKKLFIEKIEPWINWLKTGSNEDFNTDDYMYE